MQTEISFQSKLFAMLLYIVRLMIAAIRAIFGFVRSRASASQISQLAARLESLAEDDASLAAQLATLNHNYIVQSSDIERRRAAIAQNRSSILALLDEASAKQFRQDCPKRFRESELLIPVHRNESIISSIINDDNRNSRSRQERKTDKPVIKRQYSSGGSQTIADAVARFETKLDRGASPRSPIIAASVTIPPFDRSKTTIICKDENKKIVQKSSESKTATPARLTICDNNSNNSKRNNIQRSSTAPQIGPLIESSDRSKIDALKARSKIRCESVQAKGSENENDDRQTKNEPQKGGKRRLSSATTNRVNDYIDLIVESTINEFRISDHHHHQSSSNGDRDRDKRNEQFRATITELYGDPEWRPLINDLKKQYKLFCYL